MKDETNLNPDPLGKALKSWEVKSPLPPRFQETVWRRISDETATPNTTLWAQFQGWFQVAFSRPAVAVAYAVVLLAIGSGTGWFEARQKSAQLDSALGTRYIQSLDPYQMPANK